MSIMFMKVRSLSRAKGDSAVAKAAYISRDKLRDQRTGVRHDYRRTAGLQHSQILVPSDASPEIRAWGDDRSRLWNAAESAERQRNSRVGREYTVSLPHELSAQARHAVAVEFAQRISDRYGVAVDLAIHGPTAKGDPRNHHIHVLASTREITAGGFGAKSTMELNTDRRREIGLPHVAAEYRNLRQMWASLANDRLREAGIAERLEPRSKRTIARDTAAELNLAADSENGLHPEAENPLETTRKRAVERWLAYKANGPMQDTGARDKTLDRSRHLDAGLDL